MFDSNHVQNDFIYQTGGSTGATTKTPHFINTANRIIKLLMT
jgi:hypothetical protein